MGTNTSVDCAAPNCARYTMILIGIRVSPEVFKTRNIIIGLLAVSFFGLMACRPSIAFSPSGVAALSSPSMLAARFMKMLPVTGCPFGMSGNSLQNIGLRMRENILMTPPASPMRMIPIQRDKTPVSPIEISKAVLDDSNVDWMMAGNMSVFPKKNSWIQATTKAVRKKAIQI